MYQCIICVTNFINKKLSQICLTIVDPRPDLRSKMSMMFISMIPTQYILKQLENYLDIFLTFCSQRFWFCNLSYCHFQLNTRRYSVSDYTRSTYPSPLARLSLQSKHDADVVPKGLALPDVNQGAGDTVGRRQDINDVIRVEFHWRSDENAYHSRHIEQVINSQNYKIKHFFSRLCK